MTPLPPNTDPTDGTSTPSGAGPESQSASATCPNNGSTWAVIAAGGEACFIEAIHYSNALPASAPPYQIYITGALTFDGVILNIPGMRRVLDIWGNNSSFTVSADDPLVFSYLSTNAPGRNHYIVSHLRLTNGGNKRNRDYGGAIRNFYALRVYDSVFDNNAAENGGGAILSSAVLPNPPSSLHLERVHFTNNRAGGGGAIQMDYGAKLTGECVMFENNGGASGAPGGYGQSVLLGSYGGSVSLRRSGMRTRYATGYGTGIWPQLFNLTTASFTIRDSYIKPSGASGAGAAAAVVVGIEDVSPNVTILSPKGSDPTLEAGCQFLPPALLPPQQVPPVACTAQLQGPINIRSTPSLSASILFPVANGATLTTEFLGVYTAGFSDRSQWWYYVRFNGSRFGWLSGQVVPNPCPSIYITPVDQSGNIIAPTPTPTPTTLPSITPGQSSTPRSISIQDQLAAYGIDPMTPGGIAWTTQELQEMLLGANAVADAFRSVSTQVASITKQQVFMTVMGLSTVPTGTKLKVIRSSTPGGYCQMDNNTVTLTCFGSTLIAPNGTPLAFTQYVVVHELGHRFDVRASAGNPPQRRLVDYMSSGQPIQDCKNTRVLGEQADVGPPDKFWTRGERGWGTGPARVGSVSPIREVTVFQQNAVLIQFQADSSTVDHKFLTNPPTLQNDTQNAKEVRVEEAAADMFLNWVYRRNAQGPSPLYAQVCSQPTSTVPVTSFLNLSWRDGIQQPIAEPVLRSGDRRFAWFDETALSIFKAQGW